MKMKRHRRFEFLAGKTIANSRGTAYQIVCVSDGDITYINQAGHEMREKADLFRQIVAYIYWGKCLYLQHYFEISNNYDYVYSLYVLWTRTTRQLVLVGM